MLWSSEDKGNNIRIKEASRIEFLGSEVLANLVRTTEQISSNNFPFYFETKVVECGENGFIGIGLTPRIYDQQNHNLPGLDPDSIGFQGYDGIIGSSGVPIQKSERYSTGDVVGCYLCCTNVDGVEYVLVQFTKNGKVLQPIVCMKNKDYYPTIGLGSPGAVLESNFGDKKFMCDIAGTILIICMIV